MITQNFKNITGNYLIYTRDVSTNSQYYGTLTDIDGKIISSNSTKFNLNYLFAISSSRALGSSIFTTDSVGSDLYYAIIPGISNVEPTIENMLLDSSDRTCAGLSFVTSNIIKGVSNKQCTLYTLLWQNRTKAAITVNCSYFLMRHSMSTILIERTKFASPVVLEPNEYLNLHYELGIE